MVIELLGEREERGSRSRVSLYDMMMASLTSVEDYACAACPTPAALSVPQFYSLEYRDSSRDRKRKLFEQPPPSVIALANPCYMFGRCGAERLVGARRRVAA
jgi:hypothetical protein